MNFIFTQKQKIYDAKQKKSYFEFLYTAGPRSRYQLGLRQIYPFR